MNSVENNTQVHVEQIAEDALAKFDNVAKLAEQYLKEIQPLGADAFGSMNTFTSVDVAKSQQRINNANQDSYRHLKTEPAIARVVIEEADGARKTYYICRCEQGIPGRDVYSNYAPIGRIAALDIGDTFTLPNGATVEVIEQAHLRPFLSAEGWDARNAVMRGETFGPLTIESLRKLLADVAGPAVSEDILEQILADEARKANIFEGVRRNVITKMGLRDQPILDKYQDEIFRLPLNKRLLILGPPGTGKTTTLIRRLGQKLDTIYLDEGEHRIVESLAGAQGVAHAQSWLMFTPTELLKQYLKEAFNREGIPAPEQQLKTWQDYRHELARNIFGILRSSSGVVFVLKDELQSLNTDALTQPLPWFEDFDLAQRGAYVGELGNAAALLAVSALPEAKALGVRLAQCVISTDKNMVSLFGQLAKEIPSLQAFVSALKVESDKKIKGYLKLQLNRNPNFLHDLARYLDTLSQSATDSDDMDDQDADDDEDSKAATTPIAKAMAAFNGAVKAQARAAAGKRSPGKNTRSGKVVEWLGERSLPESERAALGTSLLMQSAARPFMNPVKRYLDDIPKRYRNFRRERQQAGRWYRSEGFETRDINSLELDVVLLSILRAGGELLSRADIQRDIDSSVWSSLQLVAGLYRNQILVDEATDFSPIQLACMAALTQPRLRSFFACGDFNQRLTTWGARSIDEMKWVFGDFEIREVSVAYRQSQQLNELARAIVRTVGGTEQEGRLPEHMDSNGVAPALMENATAQKVILWLAERIREIDQFYEHLPSIAIFVNAEDEVAPMAEQLNSVLGESNIRVMACREGQSVGRENDVRVFDTQHIKGLEFEAVFFVGIDRLAQLHPTLFDKYLYVGTTRAATYLGITCEAELPPAIESLRSHFGEHWKIES